MSIWPSIRTERVVSIYRDAISMRRELYGDAEFFNVPDFWDAINDEDSRWSLKLYKSGKGEDFLRTASVAGFGEQIVLVADEELWFRAKSGCPFCNLILGHELGHLDQNHTRDKKRINFLRYSMGSTIVNVPANIEEYEADLWGVFFLCGVALANPRWDYRDLAKRAHCDQSYVKRAQAMVRLEIFQKELNKPLKKIERVVL